MNLLEVREELDSVLTVFSDHLISVAYSFPASVDVMIWIEQVRIGRCATIRRLKHQITNQSCNDSGSTLKKLFRKGTCTMATCPRMTTVAISRKPSQPFRFQPEPPVL